MSKKLNINDIAKLAGVGTSTVSRYFNGGYVGENTKKKLQKIIEEHNYEPNTFAQILKAKRSKLIGIIVPRLDSYVTSRVLMAIDEQLRKSNYTSLIINTSQQRELEVKSIENLWRLNVDGIILIATEITKMHEEAVKKIDVPIVFVGQKYEKGISIINDDYNAGKFLGSYVGKRGHRDILYLGVTENDVSVGIERKNGVIDGLKSQKIDSIRIEITDFGSSNSEKLVYELLKSYKPSAIVCATDRIALGALKAITKSSLNVPNDISLVGFGGYDVSSIITPQLTTIRFQNEITGILSAETIIKLIDDNPIPKTQIINFEFIEGESVSKILC